MDDQEKPKSLVSKLCQVMAATGRVPKEGWNDFHKYKFARESDIVESIRGELAQRNVFIFPTVTSHDRSEYVNQKGNKAYFTNINVYWTFRDGDSDESFSIQIPGTAEDTGDKGFYKAFTGSEKYMLTKTFLIPTGDDPENDDGKSNNAAPAQSAPTGRHYDLKPVPSAPAPPRATEEEEYGKSVGVVGKINPAEDGKCWFLSIGHLGTAKGETIWCKDKTLVDSLKVGMEIQASLRSKAPGKYQLLSFVPVDDDIPGIAK